MELKIEYLILIEKRASEALYRLCDSLAAFDKFIQSESSLIITKGKITCNASCTFNYDVTVGEVTDKEQRYFHLRLGCPKEDEGTIDQFVELSRSIKRLVHDAGGQPETLWNDISLFYSKLAYPLVHHVENLMRKLITYFMLTTVGKEWTEETFPVSVKEAVDKSKRKQYLDVLYQVDFIHLGDFLFKEYQTKSQDELFDKLDEIDLVEFDADSLANLQSFRPRSNWKKYFSRIVKCEDAYLDRRWKQLYELRCMVAHNSLIGKDEYERIQRLADEVAGPLQKALDNLHKVVIPDEDKEQVAENVVSNISALYGEYIMLWKQFEAILSTIRENSSKISENSEIDETTRRLQTPRVSLMKLRDSEVIDDEDYKTGEELIFFRNQLVHEPALYVSEHEITDNIRRLTELTDALKTLSKPLAFNDECVQKVEKCLNLRFMRRTQTTYIAENQDKALTCAVSKAHGRGSGKYFWFGFHRHQKQFLETSSQSYVAFGCGAEDTVVLIPFNDFVVFLDFMSVSEGKGRYYWHVHIALEGDDLMLQLSGKDPVNLSKYLIPH